MTSTFSKIIRDRRISLGLSQMQLAIKADVSSPSVISRYESGLHGSYRESKRIVEALGLGAEVLALQRIENETSRLTRDSQSYDEARAAMSAAAELFALDA